MSSGGRTNIDRVASHLKEVLAEGREGDVFEMVVGLLAQMDV
ncbi:hypothetical protein [Vulgatibacter incomptus]|uniref:Uncharacterized protein n=1 Tax=Vulgatibacter incomptus TaxID=1391653 RepID=A0A0K1PBG9_9BACT|nr:hypothetical protein [Vulgatibacter incomptus]AKU90870.1 hypothetical protein AKJ08_1257 [Vulgatibacter incomptus]